jgi:hypothetical protein
MRFPAVVVGALVALSLAAAALAVSRPTTDLKALPLGDGKTSTAGPRQGYVYECQVMQGGGGAFQDGPWIHGSTFDETAKAVVPGAVSWPGTVSFKVQGQRLVIRGNGLPVKSTTGTFPIPSASEAYKYDRNPNSVSGQTVLYSLPLHPQAAKKPSCLSGGPVGIAVNGVAIEDALDGENRDAVAHEVQDSCQGHPQQGGRYHYHNIPSCLYGSNSKRASRLVGYALDGYPIYGPRGAGGRLYSDADLDACHGLTSWVTLRSKRVKIYHYVATLEYPYTLGCYHGTPLAQQGAGGGGPGGPPPPPPHP